MSDVKILVSPGYGAGWSTWNSTHKEFLLKDPTLVEMAERVPKADEQEVAAYIKSKLGDVHVFTGGWSDIEVDTLPKGTLFKVVEYDGYESVECRDSEDWSVA
jgi:ribosomal protein L30E